MFFIRLFQTFVVYCVLGWIMECSFHAVWEKKLINRGFLNGPYIPIYGFGALLVVRLLEPFCDHWLAVFFVSAVLATALEYITGWAMEKLFKNRWWDYSMFPLNLHGRICLLFSIGWGVLCLILVYLINPLVVSIITLPPDWLSISISIFLLVVMAFDLTITIRATVDLNQTLQRLETVRTLVQKRSGEFTDSLQYRMAVMVKGFIIWRRQAGQLGYVQRRWLRAFPKMRSLNYQKTFKYLRNQVIRGRRHFVFRKIRIPGLRQILASIELPPRPVLRNPFRKNHKK